MARQVGFNNRFNAGELSPEAWSDSDLQQHAHGCALGLNGTPLVTGPMAKRAGTYFVGLTGEQDEASVLLPFARTPEDALMIELGAGYGRPWQTDQTPVMDGPDPYEFSHSYTEGQLAGLRPRQNGDVIVLCHADSSVRTKRLKRLAATNWVFGDYLFENGPWRTENVDDSWTLTVTAATATADVDGTTPAVGSIRPDGTVTLVSSAPLFDPLHVGGLFRVRQSDGNPGVDSWTPKKSYGSDEYCLSVGRVYQRTGGSGDAGTTPIVHEGGEVSDGRLLWTYRHDGGGVIKITSVSDSTHATGTVEKAIPFKSGNSTRYWSEGAFSDYRGWPTAAPAVREERFVFAAPAAEPDKFDATTTAGFTADKGDFTPGLGTGRVVDTDAVRRYAGDEPGRIVWLLSAAQLVFGSTAQEGVISGATLDDPLSPSGCTARALTDYGSADVMPVKAHGSILYVMSGGEILRELTVAADQSFSTRDMTVLSSHIGERGLVDLAWQKTENRLWARLGDGGWASFVYHVEQQVYGWTQMELAKGGWTMESVATLPGEGGRVVMWAIASRTKDGATQRAVVAMARPRDEMHYDLAEVYEGAAATGVAGLDHLEGERVSLMTGEGAEYTDILVTDGEAMLPANAPGSTRIWAGLPYSFRFESLPLDLQGPGSTQGKVAQMLQALVTMKGVKARVGTSDAGARLDPIFRREPAELSGLTRKRFVEKVTFNGDAGTDPRVVVEDDSGYPLSIHMIRPLVNANA